MRNELLPKRSPDKNQRLVMLNDIYHVKYIVRNSLDKLKHFQTFPLLNHLKYFGTYKCSKLLSFSLKGAKSLIEIVLIWLASTDLRKTREIIIDIAFI